MSAAGKKAKEDESDEDESEEESSEEEETPSTPAPRKQQRAARRVVQKTKEKIVAVKNAGSQRVWPTGSIRMPKAIAKRLPKIQQANEEAEKKKQPQGVWRASKASVFAEAVDVGQSNNAMAEGSVKYPQWAQVLAEAVGSFVIVLTVGISMSRKFIYAPVAIGMALAVQTCVFAKVSGGMFNPAVSFAVLLSGRQKMTLDHFIACASAQFGGSLLAAITAFGVTQETFCFENSLYTVDGSLGASFALEVIFTAALCHTYLSTATSFDAPNDYFGFAIGSALIASLTACSSYHQGCFNPAVTWGINFANYGRARRWGDPTSSSWCLYLGVPFLGAAVAAAIFRLTRRREFTLLAKAAAAELPSSLFERLVAESAGTFILVLTNGLAGPATLQVAPVAVPQLRPVATGLALAAQVYSFGSVCGGLFNPAVAVAVTLSGRAKLSRRDCVAYIAVQCLAALLAALVAATITQRAFYFDQDLIPRGTVAATLVTEVAFSCTLATAVLATTTSDDSPTQYFGFVIGGALLAANHACGGYMQGSFNPATAFGVNIANYFYASKHPSFQAWMLHIFGPILGGCLASWIFWYTRFMDVKEAHDRTAQYIDLNRKSRFTYAMHME